MVIILDSFGPSDELGAELPEAAETRASLNFVDRTTGMSDIFWYIFYRSGFTQDLWWFDQVETLDRCSDVWYCIFKLDC